MLSEPGVGHGLDPGKVMPVDLGDSVEPGFRSLEMLEVIEIIIENPCAVRRSKVPGCTLCFSGLRLFVVFHRISQRKPTPSGAGGICVLVKVSPGWVQA